ncbi:hypothetical protein E6C76_04360 [Pseudothauera nasutitermitis]|uniref:MFS transporter n=1 Tax=Pseudothauera nasutitermitis TaxID=2565930 RepID=A0A4S4B108_9RHOO|nr:hypothetical protein [Pseudothauera nasutitermitis]THF66099.1 hypothetical protein E6C76_04360 [Pseudothauera nasutitermitis]
MKRLLLILLAVLLPVQSALAALDAYCALEDPAPLAAACMDACHRGGDAGGEDGSARLHPDCHSCHLAQFAMVAAAPPLAPSARADAHAGEAPGFLASHPPARPERPKWRGPSSAPA